jgi:hypothetical protein
VVSYLVAGKVSTSITGVYFTQTRNNDKNLIIHTLRASILLPSFVTNYETFVRLTVFSAKNKLGDISGTNCKLIKTENVSRCHMPVLVGYAREK